MEMRKFLLLPLIFFVFGIANVGAVTYAGTDYDIAAVCAAKWRGVHKMRAHCEEKHYEGYGIYRGFQYRYGLHLLSTDEFDSAVKGHYLPAEIISSCSQRWLNKQHKNYQMMAYCVVKREATEKHHLYGISQMLLQLRRILADAGHSAYQ